MQESYRHILKYIGVFGGVQGLTLLLGLVRNKVIAVLLGPAGVGLLSLCNSLVRLLSDVGGMGLAVSGTRFVAERQTKREQGEAVAVIRQWALLAAVSSLVLTCVLSYPLSLWVFGDEWHVLAVLLLAPAVFMTILAGGELCVLKGLGYLHWLALASVASVVGVLLLTVPLYVVFGIEAIEPSIMVASLWNLCAVMFYSRKAAPLGWYGEWRIFRKYTSVLRLGGAFVVAALFGSLTDMLFRSFLNVTDGPGVVGIYNAGYMLCMTLAGAFYSSMETDYYPRLTRVKRVGVEFNGVVNRQITLTLLVVTPVLWAFIVGAPLLIPLLYSGKFVEAIPFIRWGMLAMSLRGVTLALEYIALSLGKSKSYLLVEGVSYSVLLLCMIIGYELREIEGVGMGMLVSGGLELLFVVFYAGKKFQYIPAMDASLIFVFQFIIGLSVACVSLLVGGKGYWLLGGGLCVMSVLVSVVAFATLVSHKKEGA